MTRSDTAREKLEFDVLIVGAGPAGLAAAIRAAQVSDNWSVAVVEKGSEVGAHILSGAVMDPRAIAELIPQWRERKAPVEHEVISDLFYYLGPRSSVKIPTMLLPGSLHNRGNVIVRLGALTRWMSEYAEQLGVHIFPGFCAHELLYEESTVVGVRTGDGGVNKRGERRSDYAPGYDLLATHTILAEGCRGHLGKQVIREFALDKNSAPPHYGIGFKEIWELPAGSSAHPQGTVIHTTGYPLDNRTEGGGYLYFLPGNQVALGLIVALNYRNPHLDPFAEFNLWKHHRVITSVLKGARRIAYGARAVHKGGLYSLPQVTFPGGILIGCDAGFLNPARIKGVHCAIKSATIAVDSIATSQTQSQPLGAAFDRLFHSSWLYEEHRKARNFHGLLHRLGTLAGAVLFTLDYKLFNARLPWRWRNQTPDHATLVPAAKAKPMAYPRPDNVVSFDRLSSIYLANLAHEEDQPCHLQLTDAGIPIQHNLPVYDEPAQRYCPAGVYELSSSNGETTFLINAQNCVHCKSCDIKDPAQNISWVTPQGGSGPNYAGM